MAEQEERLALIKLSYPDGGKAGYHCGIDEGGGRYLCAYTDPELAETHMRVSGLRQPDVARVVEWPAPMVKAFAKESPVFAYVRVDPPLTEAQLLAEIVAVQRHARHVERRLDELEQALARGEGGIQQ